MAGANNQYPIIDTIAPSWADIKVKLTPDGGSLIVVSDIKAINSGVTVEVGRDKAGGRLKRATTGDATIEAGMTVSLPGSYILEQALLAPAQAAGYVRDGNVVQIGLVRFNIEYSFTPPGSELIYERRLKGCRLLSDPETHSEGTDPTVVEYTLLVHERVKVIDGVEYALL